MMKIGDRVVYTNSLIHGAKGIITKAYVRRTRLQTLTGIPFWEVQWDDRSLGRGVVGIPETNLMLDTAYEPTWEV